MSIEDFKRKVVYTNNTDGNKSVIINHLANMACMFLSYVFTTTNNGRVINNRNLTPGIHAVTRDILHPRIGNLQVRTPNNRNDPIILTNLSNRPPVSTTTPPVATNTPPVATNTPPVTNNPQTVPWIQGQQRNRPPNNVATDQYFTQIRISNEIISRELRTNDILQRRRLNIYVPTYVATQNTRTQPEGTPAVPPPKIHKTEKQCSKDSDCAICFNKLNDETYVFFDCNHEFCKPCIIECLSRKINKCSLCRNLISNIYTKNPTVTYSL